MIQAQWGKSAQTLVHLRPDLLDVRELKPRAVDVDLRLAQCYGQLLNDAGRAGAYRRVVAAAPRACPRAWGSPNAGESGAGRRRLRDLPRDEFRHPRDAGQHGATALGRSSPPAEGPALEGSRTALDAASRRRRIRPGCRWSWQRSAWARAIKAAREVLEQARDRAPERVDLWVALAEVAARQEQPQAALPILDAAEKRWGIAWSCVWPAPTTGSDAAVPGRPALAKLEEKPDGFSRQEQRRLLSGLAFAYAQLGAARESDRLWAQLAEQHPQDLGIRLSIFDLAMEAGDEGRTRGPGSDPARRGRGR